eukprot:CAMPEP_0175145040 /NCGR_PEP_ID=MMETSP0087-20121206/14516_1 /TAXON_ID=136419 /ORGANISM="Unknown Unknown, Strain D1" /LENGTH=64 /DNA_ID=CAMNT_0016429675 /DNA_START=31 /DNA_END=222 /DNA_ORIENTATION=+
MTEARLLFALSGWSFLFSLEGALLAFSRSSAVAFLSHPHILSPESSLGSFLGPPPPPPPPPPPT